MSKIAEVNLEYGHPSVEDALRSMVNYLGTYKRQGYKAVILVHGYGSSGVGGSIKTAVHRRLKEKSLCGIVQTFCAGNEWYLRKRELLNACNSLAQYDQKISNNEGVTVVVLKK